MRGFNRGNHFGGVVPVVRRDPPQLYDIENEAKKILSEILRVPGHMEGVEELVSKGIEAHLNVCKSVSETYTFQIDMCEADYSVSRYKYPEILLMTDYVEPKLSKKPSLAPFYALCDIQSRENVFSRLNGIDHILGLGVSSPLEIANVFDYHLLSDKIFEKPRFVSSETDNGYDRKGALKKFIQLCRPDVVFLLGGGSGGGECITVLGPGIKKVYVISFIGYDTTQVVSSYYHPIFKSMVEKGVTSYPSTSLIQVFIPLTFDHMKNLSREEFAKILIEKGVTLNDFTLSSVVCNFLCELDHLLDLFSTSFMIYGDVDTTIGLPVVTLPPRHPDSEFDSFYLTQWMLSVDPTITMNTVTSWYDPEKNEIAVFAEHSSFRDKVFSRSRFRTRSGVVDVKIIDFLGSKAQSTSRLYVRIGCGVDLSHLEVAPFVADGVVDISLFFLITSSSLFLPAYKVEVVTYGNLVEIIEGRDVTLPYVGRYYYFDIGGKNYYIDYSDYSRSYTERLLILKSYGLRVYSPSSVPRWAVSYVLSSSLRRVEFRAVIMRKYFVSSETQEFSPETLPAIEVSGLSYDKVRGIVVNPRGRILISPSMEAVPALDSRHMKSKGGYRDPIKGRFVRLTDSESVSVTITDNKDLRLATLEDVIEIVSPLEVDYASILIYAFHNNLLT